MKMMIYIDVDDDDDDDDDDSYLAIIFEGQAA